MSVFVPAAVLDHVYEAVVVLDVQHRIQYLNPRFEKIFSTSKAHSVGLKLENFLKLSADWNWQEVYSLHTLKTYQTELQASLSNLPIQITVIPIPTLDGQKTFVFYFDDFSTQENALAPSKLEPSAAEKLDEILFVAALPEMANSSNSSEEFLSRSQLKLIRSFRFHAIATWVHNQDKKLALAGYQTDGQAPKDAAGMWFAKYHRNLDEALESDMPKQFSAEGFDFLVVPHKKRSSMFAITLVALPFGKRALESQIKILQIFGHQLAVSYENTKLQEVSTIDGLTQIHNAKFFHGRLASELIIAETTETPISLLLFDVDHFKKFNDKYGHLTGDLVLSDVAKTAKNACRRSDLVCRYGGEEFAVILIDTDVKGAQVVAEKIRSAIEARIPDPNRPEIKITVSVGIATFPDHAGTKEELVERADSALYVAKNAGRNRISLYQKSST